MIGRIVRSSFRATRTATPSASSTVVAPAAPLSITPALGDASGGTVVTIGVTASAGLTGAKLVNPTTMTAYPFTGVSASSGSTLAATSPALPEDDTVYDLVVSNLAGDSPPLTGVFSAMFITDAFPDVVSKLILTHISIGGKGFAGADAGGGNGVFLVDGGGTPHACDSVVVTGQNADDVSFRTPTGLSAGVYTVRVVTPSGTVNGATGAIRLWDPADIAAGCAGHWDVDVNSVIGGVIALTDLSGGSNPLAAPSVGAAPTFTQSDPAAGYSTRSTMLWPNVGPGANTTRMTAAIGGVANPFSVCMYGYPGDPSSGVVWYSPGGSYETTTSANDGGGSFSLPTEIRNGARLRLDERQPGATTIYDQQFASAFGTGTTGTNPITTGITFGNVTAGGLGSQEMKLQFAFVAKGQLTNTEKGYLRTYALSREQVEQPAARTCLYITGNSIEFGDFASAIGTTDWAALVIKGLPKFWKGVKDGNPGIQTTSIKDCHTLAPLQTLCPNEIVAFDEIINDIMTGGVSAATGYSNWQAWAANLFSILGISKRIGMTCMKSSLLSGPQETIRQTINASLLSGATALSGITYWYLRGDGIYIYDKASLPHANDPTDLRYFFDGLHPTDILHADIAVGFNPGLAYVAAH